MTYPPGPSTWSFGFGTARQIKRDILGFYMRMARTYGDVVYMRLGPYRDYSFFHPDAIREVLVTKARHFEKMPMQRRIFSRWIGNGLLISEGDVWLRQRRLMQPAFHPRRFAAYGRMMVECTRQMLDAWLQGSPSGGSVDVPLGAALTDLTLAIICKTMFGADVRGEARQLGQAVAVLNEVAMREMMNPLLTPDWLPLPFKFRKRWAIRLLHGTLEQIIRERRADGEDRGDLLSMLLLARDEEGDGAGLSDEEIRDQAMTFFLAGHDTTAAGLLWALYLLAKHPEAEARVAAEVSSVLQDRLPAAEDAAKLLYTQMVLREAMRLYPPAIGAFARCVTEEVQIAGYTLHPGSVVHVFNYVTHHDPRWFPDPERFDPERFAAGWEQRAPQFAYWPFGGGPRVCIGNQFAFLEMTLIVATLMQRCRLETPPGQPDAVPVATLALRPKDEIRLRLSLRQPALAGARA
jgi:cytochrome P450